MRNKSPPPTALPGARGGAVRSELLYYSRPRSSRSSCNPLGEIKFSKKSGTPRRRDAECPRCTRRCSPPTARRDSEPQPRRFEKRFRPILGHVTVERFFFFLISTWHFESNRFSIFSIFFYHKTTIAYQDPTRTKTYQWRFIEVENRVTLFYRPQLQSSIRKKTNFWKIRYRVITVCFYAEYTIALDCLFWEKILNHYKIIRTSFWA